MPPDLAQLKKQLENRDIRRIEIAKKEVEIAMNYDWLIVNRNVKTAADEVIQIMELIRKAGLKNSWNKNFIESFY